MGPRNYELSAIQLAIISDLSLLINEPLLGSNARLMSKSRGIS